MPKDFPRTRRVAEQIQRELAEIIRLELKDPRVGMVTLTDVEVTADYAHARIYFTIFGDEAKVATTQSALEHAAGFLRSELAHRLKFRTVPQLHFKYDTSIERGMHLSSLIDRAVASDKPQSGE